MVTSTTRRPTPFAVRSSTKLGQRSDLVKSKPMFFLFAKAFPPRALFQPISSPINRWQGPQWCHPQDLQQLVTYKPNQPSNHLTYFFDMISGREMTSLPGFLTLNPIPGPNANELPPIHVSTFIAITLENTPFTNHTSTSANSDPMISSAFVEANYEVLESLLRERRRHRCNEDLRTKLEYFSEEYDKEREMEPRPVRVRETTPVCRTESSRVRRQKERVIEFEDAPSRDGSRVERNSEGGRHSERRAEDSKHQGMNLPHSW
ncbi:hypothetical protein Tco_1226653 [Tanacetum coccineum]